MAGERELLSVDDKDVFAAALSDQPPAEAPVEAEAEPKPEETRPRDEQGRFLPKAADAETPQQPAAEQQAGQPLQAEPPEKPEDLVPSWRLREVSQERRNEAQARQAAEERSRVLEAQLQRFMQQQERQQQQPPELPDFIEQPQAFAQAIRDQARQEIEGFRIYLEQREIERSLKRADQTYGKEFQEAYIAFNDPALRGDVRLLEQVRNAYDQGEAILAWHRQQKTLREVGSDPKAYRQKLKAELLNDPEFRKEFGETLRGQATTKPSSVTSLPNLARAPGSAGNSHDDWPTTDAGIFDTVAAGMNRR